MIQWCAQALAGEGAVAVLAGVRTAPDAALEQPSEWEPEIEPTAIAAIVGRWRSQQPAWWGVDASAWGLAPEPDAVLLAVGPRAGLGADRGAARLDAAARYDLQAYPFSPEVTNGRAEALAKVGLRSGAVDPEVAVLAIDRHYLLPEWSFRALEAGVAARLHTRDDAVRLTLGSGWQVNQGHDSAVGDQLRATVEAGGSAGRIDAWAAWRLVVARGGAPERAARPVFTPVGDYSEDADALSSGGFLQHRAEVGASAEAGPWTLRGSVLGRIRFPEALATGTVDRTLHGHFDLLRETGGGWSVLGAAGASGTRIVGGASYLDVYGWAGLSRELE